MFWISTKRIIKSGIINFSRSGSVSVASTMIMTIVLLSVGTVFFTSNLLNEALSALKQKVDINAYFTTTAKEEDILSIKKSLEALPEVSYVEYISREQALLDFRENNAEDQLVIQALDELNENPLGAVLNIKAKEPSQYEGIATFLKDESNLSPNGEVLIDEVNYFQNKIVIEKLSDISRTVETAGFAGVIILAVIAILVTFNTVRLAIYSAREEIGIMRLVGASNTYIRGPFVIAGILSGFIAGASALIIFYPIALWLGPVTEKTFGLFNLLSFYGQNFLTVAALIFGTGILLGAISSFLAVRKYLNV